MKNYIENLLLNYGSPFFHEKYLYDETLSCPDEKQIAIDDTEVLELHDDTERHIDKPVDHTDDSNLPFNILENTWHGLPFYRRFGLCSKVTLHDLKLPRKNANGIEFYEIAESEIQFLFAIRDRDKPESTIVKRVAHAISRINSIIEDNSKIEVCIVTLESSRARLLCGKRVLIIHISEFNIRTAIHEASHHLFHSIELLTYTANKHSIGAENFLKKVADIYCVLRTMYATFSPSEEINALAFVDPTFWDTKGAKEEHPLQDVSELFASAVEAFLINVKGLEASIKKFFAANNKVRKPMEDLLDILKLLLIKKRFPTKVMITSKTEDINLTLTNGLGMPKMEDTLNPKYQSVLAELLNVKLTSQGWEKIKQ